MILFWPRLPEQESWHSDVPNEGIAIEDDGTIMSFKEDNCGTYILDAHSQGGLEPVLHLPLGDSLVYYEAYLALFQAIRKGMSVEEIKSAVTLLLLKLGWRQVAFHEHEAVDGARFFKYV